MALIQPEETIASKVIYSGAVVNLRKDTVRLPGGRETEREIVEHAGVVVMAPVTESGAVLMVRQYRKPVEQILLELPAGGIEEGESLEAAVRLEMVEETGFTPKSIDPLITVYPSPGISDEVMHIFVVSELEGDGQQTEAVDELEVVTVPLARAVEMIRVGELTDAKSVVGVLMLESSRST